MSRKNALAAIADKQKKQTTQLNPNLMIEITNEDNMELMKRYPDNYFDLAIVDPPYGIGISSNPVRQQHKKKEWDSAIPNRDYFDELFRVSKNQIIWGGNYFDLPPTQGFLIWDKKQPHDFSLAMVEYAWSSIQKPAKMWSLSVLKERGKIHPTQKPVELYSWILKNNTEAGFKLLDTHIGSGSIAIAVDNANKIDKMNLTLVGCELDKDYYNATMKRIKEQTSWQSLF
jgi:site-specific DNA-methyltransferase (adenine-specific)